ncbi:MAG: phosphatidylcholine/phosphatidylserine synthase [Kiritimatiellae bacterium]|nr:phosphatidylcholine/phosphatidylserine synthase [Kiritimatiellia bacterium]
MGKFRLRKRRQRHVAGEAIPVRSMIPNLVTFMAAASGITSIRFSCNENWRAAVLFILLAALCDGLDGRVARMLRATSKLGAELDSLSDFVSFGVAPGMLVYFWMMQEVYASTAAYAFRGCFWALALFYALCCAFRLARFNIMLEMPTQPYWKHFFMGLPAPGGAGLVVMPIIWELHSKSTLSGTPWYGAASLLVCGLLLACRLPTPSLKHIRIPANRMIPVLLAVMLLFGMLFAEFWGTLFYIGMAYYAAVPVCSIVFCRLKKACEKK